MTLILGPADADHFRVKVGRYGDRWYADPLPGCGIAPATEVTWPAVSTVKKASGQDWSFVAMKRIAHAERAELERMPGLDPAQRYDTCKSINQHGLNVAAGRGTILHWWGEDMLHGRPLRPVTPLELVAHKIPAASLEHANRYLPALRQFFDTYQPELIATEYVVVHRDLGGVGYGATPDGLWVIDGETYAYDFKSRSEDGDHAAYPEEGGQIAAGVRAQYMIVEGAAGAERRPIPAVSGGMVVSIKPDGCRVFPVDVDKAFEHWQAMHAWWCARRFEREGVGRPWPVRKVAAPVVAVEPDAAGGLAHPPADVLAARLADLLAAGHRERMLAAWPSGVPGFKGGHAHTVDELERIAAAIQRVCDETSQPFGPDDATLDTPTNPAIDALTAQRPATTPPPPVDEGETVDSEYLARLAGDLADLPDVDRQRIEHIAVQAHEAGVSISLRQLPSRRRWWIVRALVSWHQVGWDEDVVRDLLSALMDSDLPRQPGVPLGTAVGALTIDEAIALDEMAQTVAAGGGLAYDGRWRVTPAA